MTKTITALDIVAGLKQAVAESGEDTYRLCRYVSYAANPEVPQEKGIAPDNTGEPVSPHCIVGVVLHMAGIPLDALVELEGSGVPGIRHSSFNAVTHNEFKIDDIGWSILANAQRVQDDGRNWGRALDEALHKARMLHVIND